MRIEKFIRDAAAIQNAYENDTLYKKVWENGSLKSMTGFGRVWAELSHLFTNNKKEIYRKYQNIFTECIKHDLDEIPVISLSPSSSSSEDDNDFLSDRDAAKTNLAFYRIEPVVIAQASKIFNHFDANIGVSEDMASIVNDLNTYIQSCRDEIERIKKKTKDQAVDAVISRREIEVVYALDPNGMAKQLRRLYRKELPRQALKAHDAFTSIWNSKPALEIAEDKRNILAFKALATSNHPRARAAAVSLLNIVKYGNEATQIERGRQQPSLFWNISKLWNTYSWRRKERVHKVLDAAQQQKFEKIDPIAQKVVRDLVNERGKEMGDNLIDQYSNVI